MVIIIHLIDGGTITLKERVFTQEQINEFFKQIDGATLIHYLEPKGKNYIIPLDKIKYIETKFVV